MSALLTRVLRYPRALFVLVALGVGCRGGPEQTARPRALTPVPVSATGRIEVEARYHGPAPEPRNISLRGSAECRAVAGTELRDPVVVVHDGALANVVVYLAGDLTHSGRPMPTGTVRLDQRGCEFVPHVLALAVTQELEVHNSDPFLHNVRSRSDHLGWNLSLARAGAARRLRDLPLGVGMRLGCDIHPWMSAWIAVFDHPYFGVTDLRGRAVLDRVPEGGHALRGWHERLGEQEIRAEVRAGRTTHVALVWPSQTPGPESPLSQ